MQAFAQNALSSTTSEEVLMKIAMHAVLACASVTALVAGPVHAATAAKADVSRGEYLVNLGGCNDCHSPKTMTPQGPVLDTSRLLSGHPADMKVPDVPPGVLG
ncbi:MAG TPA: hypothetical protein VFC24_14545, partial [Casimicrobiaceae bacterium]|nr:hypothetical protein [Casimicrobiaceae bacterium]